MVCMLRKKWGVTSQFFLQGFLQEFWFCQQKTTVKQFVGWRACSCGQLVVPTGLNDAGDSSTMFSPTFRAIGHAARGTMPLPGPAPELVRITVVFPRIFLIYL